MVETPLRHPEPYFRRWNGFSVSRAFAVVAVLWLSILVGTIGLVLLLATRVEALPPGAVGKILGIGLTQAIPMLFVLVLSWLLMAGLLYAAARLKGGRGSFMEMLAVAGWGLAPTVVVILLTLAIAGYAVSTATFPADLESAAQKFARILDRTDGGAVVVLQLGAAAWQAHIFAGGVSVSHDLEFGDALIVGGVVAGLGFVLAVL